MKVFVESKDAFCADAFYAIETFRVGYLQVGAREGWGAFCGCVSYTYVHITHVIYFSLLVNLSISQ
jgi:hypothetical protein